MINILLTCKQVVEARFHLTIEFENAIKISFSIFKNASSKYK